MQNDKYSIAPQSTQIQGQPQADPHTNIIEPNSAVGPDRSNPPLSPTETRVYHLLLKRLTEQQVAEQMDRSPNTVHVHVRNIYRKLGVRSRKQLIELPKDRVSFA